MKSNPAFAALARLMLSTNTEQHPFCFSTPYHAARKRRFSKQASDYAGLIKGLLPEDNRKTTYNASREISKWYTCETPPNGLLTRNTMHASHVIGG